MGRLRGMVVIGLALLALGATVGGAQELVVVTEEWPPYRIADRSRLSGFAGIDVDVLDALAERLGVTFVIEQHPFARCLELIRTGQADVITGIAYTAERDEYIAYVPTSYSRVQPVFYTQAGRADEFAAYDDLYGATVGYSVNSAYFEPFNSDESLTKVAVSTERQLLQMVALGRLDMTVGTDPNISWDVARYGFRDALEPARFAPDVATPLYLGFSAASPASSLLDEFDAVLRDLLESGAMDEILARYR